MAGILLTRHITSGPTAIILLSLGTLLTVSGIFAYPAWMRTNGTISEVGVLYGGNFHSRSLLLQGSADIFAIEATDQFQPPLPSLAVGDPVQLFMKTDLFHLTGTEYRVIAVRKGAAFFSTSEFKGLRAKHPTTFDRFAEAVYQFGLPVGLVGTLLGAGMGLAWADRRRFLPLPLALCLGSTAACFAPLLNTTAVSNFATIALIGDWPWLVWAIAVPVGSVAGTLAIQEEKGFARPVAIGALLTIGGLSAMWIVHGLLFLVMATNALGAGTTGL